MKERHYTVTAKYTRDELATIATALQHKAQSYRRSANEEEFKPEEKRVAESTIAAWREYAKFLDKQVQVFMNAHKPKPRKPGEKPVRPKRKLKRDWDIED